MNDFAAKMVALSIRLIDRFGTDQHLTGDRFQYDPEQEAQIPLNGISQTVRVVMGKITEEVVDGFPKRVSTMRLRECPEIGDTITFDGEAWTVGKVSPFVAADSAVVHLVEVSA